MAEIQSPEESGLAREALRRMCDEGGVLPRAQRVLELVAHSSVGLGEVLQDYACQASSQLHSFIRAGRTVAAGGGMKSDAEALGNATFILKTVKSVLERTPDAMQRNKAETLCEKSHIGREEILGIAHDFTHSPDIARLLASENASDLLIALIPAEDDSQTPACGEERARNAASH